MIEHTVMFRLKPDLDAAGEASFLQAANDLARIEGVREFAIRRQISAQCPYSYGITMRFDSQDAYDRYSAHPAHEAFVENYWRKYVDAFQEADFLPLD